MQRVDKHNEEKSGDHSIFGYKKEETNDTPFCFQDQKLSIRDKQKPCRKEKRVPVSFCVTYSRLVVSFLRSVMCVCFSSCYCCRRSNKRIGKLDNVNRIEREEYLLFGGKTRSLLEDDMT
jgi:hypothetical protein